VIHVTASSSCPLVRRDHVRRPFVWDGQVTVRAEWQNGYSAMHALGGRRPQLRAQGFVVRRHPSTNLRFHHNRRSASGVSRGLALIPTHEAFSRGLLSELELSPNAAT
jgi:hypothetical protein